MKSNSITGITRFQSHGLVNKISEIIWETVLGLFVKGCNPLHYRVWLKIASPSANLYKSKAQRLVCTSVIPNFFCLRPTKNAFAAEHSLHFPVKTYCHNRRLEWSLWKADPWQPNWFSIVLIFKYGGIDYQSFEFTTMKMRCCFTIVLVFVNCRPLILSMKYISASKINDWDIPVHDVCQYFINTDMNLRFFGGRQKLSTNLSGKEFKILKNFKFFLRIGLSILAVSVEWQEGTCF